MTRVIPKDSSLHEKLVRMLSARLRYAEKAHAQKRTEWERAEDAALAYLPERESDALRRADRDRGQPQYTTIQIPYSYALIMAAHTYWTSVFFARSPVHQYAGRHGESEQQVQCMEALMAYQVEVGQMLAPYYIWLYDMAKYGHGILGMYWDKKVVQYSQLSTIIDPSTGAPVRQQETFRVEGYQGNCVYNVSPFDFFHDPRYPIGRFQEGEFCGVRKLISWGEALRRKAAGYYMNLDSVTDQAVIDKLARGSSSLVRPETRALDDDYMAAEPGQRKHPTSFWVYEIYVELVQREWGLGDSDFPEKWVFTLTGDLMVLVGAQPLGAAHGQFPFDIGQAEVEGYGTYVRGLPEIMKPIQNTMDWLVNQHFFNVRAALNNQFVIDPSKIVIKDAEDGGPGFVYRMRPEAYGMDISKFFFQVPVPDMTANHMQGDLQSVLGIGERVSGINDAMFGAVAAMNSGSSRRTATEVRTGTGFGVNRLKTNAEFISAQAFSPHSQKLVQQTQQWMDKPIQLRIVGDLAQLYGANFLMVSPDQIAGFYDFTPVDGVLPIDRAAMATLWQQLMGQLRNLPQILLQFDIAKIFAHVAQLSGIRNVNQFRIQIQDPEVLAQQADRGNVIPLRGPMQGRPPVPQLPMQGGDLEGALEGDLQ